MLGKARVIGFALAMLASPVALAQGSFTNGQTLFTDNACGDCHEFLGSVGLQAIRDQIAQRTTPQPGLNYTKSLMALTAALGGTDLDNDATGMDAMFMFTDAQRLDLATYIANLPNPTPIVSYSPAVGAVFSATAVGATSTQTVTVTNTGNAALVFATNGAATIATGPFFADFSVSTSQASSFCQSVTLQPGVGSCTIMVQFSPQPGAATARQASLALVTTAPATPTLVSILGNLPGAPPPVTPPGAPPAGTPPPTNSANSPSGGGALPWQALGLLLALIPAIRRRPLQ